MNALRKHSRLVLGWLVMLVFVVVAILALNNKPVTNDNVITLDDSTNIVLEVKIPKQATAQFTQEYVETESAYEFLNRLEDTNPGFSYEYEDYGDLGAFPTKFLDREADTSSNEFWKFFVNNQESSLGISTYILEPGDLITFEIDTF